MIIDMSNSTLTTPGETLRDAGAALVLRGEHDAWKADVADRIAALARLKMAFTVTEVREVVGDPEKPQSWGAAFLAAFAKGIIVPVGYTVSPRSERHAGPVRIWIGV